MWRVQWRNGEIIGADHFLRLEDWVLRQVVGGRLTDVAGLLPILPSTPGAKPKPLRHLVELGEDSPQHLLCGPLRALTSSGALIEIDDQMAVPLDADSVHGDWRTLYLLIGGAATPQPLASDLIEVEPQGPIRALPTLLLSTRATDGDDRLPVARARMVGRNAIALDDAYVPPCAVVEGHLRVAEEASAWRDLLSQLNDAAIGHIVKRQEQSTSAREEDLSHLLWGLCKPVAYMINDRPLTAERFFRTVGGLASDLLKLFSMWKRDVEDEQGALGIADRLAEFDASITADLAQTLEQCVAMRRVISRAARFPETRQSFIRLSGDAEVSRDVRNNRWTTRLLLVEPLGNVARLTSNVLVAFNLEAPRRDVEVRIHPTLKWSSIGGQHIKRTRHDLDAVGLDSGRFNAYFVYQPVDKTSLESNQIVFHSTTGPIVSNQSSVMIKVLGDA